MRRTIASAAAIVLMAGAAGPAFAKGHSQPAPAAEFGQFEVAGPQAQNLDARALTDEEKGVDGQANSTEQKNKDAPVFDPPAKPMPKS